MKLLHLFGLVYAMISLILWVATWYVGFRKGDYSKRCTAKTTGTVSGVSSIHYAGHHIPRVSYVVNNCDYCISGPKFKSGTAFPFCSSNLTTRENLPGHLVAPVNPLERVDEERYSMHDWYSHSALGALYPMGSIVNVFYNPSDPAEAYVDRYVAEGWVGRVVVMTLAISFTLATICIFWLDYSGLIQS